MSNGSTMSTRRIGRLNVAVRSPPDRMDYRRAGVCCNSMSDSFKDAVTSLIPRSRSEAIITREPHGERSAKTFT